MKTMQGELRFAWSNRSRTREAPTPTNISTNSEPLMEKKGTPASPATALASSVLPVPGGPSSSTPLGMRAPRAANFSGNFRNSTTSSSSSFASSTPATSMKVTLGRVPLNMRARLLPKFIAWVLVPWAWRRKKKRMATMKMMGRNWKRRPGTLLQKLCFLISIGWEVLRLYAGVREDLASGIALLHLGLEGLLVALELIGEVRPVDLDALDPAGPWRPR